jgi:hypothetical protein
MPVAVHIPIRIRIDAEALCDPEHGMATLESALDSALQRVLDNSRSVVLDARGGYVTTQFELPDFTWMGDGLAQLSSYARTEIEAMIETIIGRKIEAAALTDYHDAHFEADAPLLEEAVAYENLDVLRTDSVLDLYEIPSYDKGDKTIVPLKRKQSTPPRTASPSYRWVKQKRANPALILQASEREFLLKMLETATKRYKFGPLGLNGVLWHQEDPKFPWGIYFQDDISGQWWSFILPPIVRYDIRPNAKPGENKYIEKFVELPQVPAKTRVLATATDQAQVIEQLTKLKADGLAANLKARHPFKEKLITLVDYDKVINGAVEQALKHEAEQVKKFPVFLVEYTALSMREILLLSAGDRPAWSGEAYLLPVIEEVAPPKSSPKTRGGTEKKGSGDKSGGAKGGLKRGTGEGEREVAEVKIRYPVMSRSADGEICEPFEGEPPFFLLEGVEDLLGGLIDDIARRLDIPSCDYAARFCLMAADVLRIRARDVGEYAVKHPTIGKLQNVAEKSGNFDTINFTPTESTPILFLRMLARVVPVLRRLIVAINTVYKEHFADFDDDKPHSFNRWLIDFNYALNVRVENAVGEIFVSGCRSVMVDLLATSAQQIDQRIKNFPAYAPLFEKLILTQLQPMEKLQKLERRLREKLHPSGIGDTAVEVVMASWHTSIDRLREIATRTDAVSTGVEGELVTVGGSYSIRDAFGILWTLTELENAIAIRGDTARSVDPMVKQITDTPALLAEFQKNPLTIRYKMVDLLKKMRDENKRIHDEVVADPLYAFQQGGFVEKGYGVSISGLSFELTGIHSNVHSLIVDFFEDDSYYGAGLQSVFKTEQAKQRFWQVGNWTLSAAIIVLSIVVPPLGIAAGALMATYGMYKAQEREGFYRSMLDPEEFISWADVEAELFSAELGLALAFIPEIGRLTGAALKGSKGVVKGAVRNSAKAAVTTTTSTGAIATARALKERFSAHLAQAIKQSLVVALAYELAKNELQDLLMEKIVFEPIQQAIQREYSVEARKRADGKDKP